MKKLLSIMFALAIVVTFTSQAYAASGAVALLKEKNGATSSDYVVAKQYVQYNVVNAGNYNVSFVLLEGTKPIKYSTVAPGKSSGQKILTRGKTKKYKIILSCDSPSPKGGTGCLASGGITAF